MTCNNVILAQPQADATVSYTIPEGDSARLNFSPEDIAGIQLGDNGELVISFTDGGQLIISNFQEMADAGSLIYLDDGTLIDPSVLTGASQTPDVFGVAEASDVEAITISQPGENTSQEIALIEGQKYICDFDPSNAELVQIIDGQLVLKFADGSQIIIGNYAEIMAGELPPELTLADGTVVDGEELLTEVLDLDDIEPAAGEEETEEVIDEEDLAALAEQLAAVQPAAGASGGSSNNGYGFNSKPVEVILESPDAIGPLNPTALRYNAPQVLGETRMALIQDDSPQVTPAIETLDETTLAGGNIVVTGTLSVNYGNDGPGTITTTGQVFLGGSLAGGNLFSGGVPVTITGTPNGYIGMAGGVPVFEFEITTGGSYTYTQYEPIDHADGTNDNDVINISFGVIAEDADGDRTPTTVRVNVLDDAPLVLSQIAETVDETDLSGGPVSQNGQFHADVGQDVVNNEHSVNDTFIASGSVAGGTLTSNGVAVVVTSAGNVYTGVAGGVTVFTLTLDPDTGNFTYDQFEPLDHADTNDPNDQITLQFGVDVTDFDGDTASGFITVNVLDDAPEIDGASETIDEDGLASGPIVETGTLNGDFNSDGAGVISPTGSFVAGGSLDNGILSHNGVAITVTQTANGYVGTAGGVTVFTLAIDPLTSNYTFTQYENLDHADNNDANDVITLTFGAQITDFDGDTATSNIVINIADSAPEFQPGGPQPDSGLETVDETDFSGGPLVETGSLDADFGVDGPGGYQGIASQVPTGLIHSGSPVTVNFNAGTNTFTGTANGNTVFTLVIDSVTGDYTYTQYETLDHPDGADHNDALVLEFGVNAFDREGDAVEGSIIINVLDDGPDAVNDSGSIREGNTLTGNVTDNDDAGADQLDAVTQVTFNGNVTAVPASGTVNVAGQYGVLTIDATGAYSYTPNNNDPDGIDQFTYTIRDRDGDTDDAVLSINVIPDYVPINISGTGTTDDTVVGNAGSDVENGTINVNYRGEGPGTTTGNGNFSSGGSQLGGNLTHNGTPVTVSFDAGSNTYTGSAGGVTVFTMVINANNSYTFTQHENLDHGNAGSNNEVLTLSFGVTATDMDGDTGTGNVVITVRDDGPDAQNDTISLARTQSVGTGNVLTNDDTGADDGQPIVVTTPGTYMGNFGTLVLNTNGTYTYTRNGRAGGVDNFTYSMRDSDGDVDTATLRINVATDHDPINISGSGATDDTALSGGPDVETGTINVNYQGDGPGTTTGTGGFSSGGSQLGGTLTHNGVPISVNFNASTNTYTGSAGGMTVFTMQINPNGTYRFVQREALDHGNASNHNESISLRFGVRATDADGDSGTGIVTIQVRDDGPNARNDSASVGRTGRSASGNVLSNDDAGEDGGALVVTPGTYNGSFGVLTINANGSYTYTRTNLVAGGTERFNYTMRDRDGDTDTATLTLNVTANPPPPPPPLPPPPPWWWGDGGDGGGDGGGGDGGDGSPLVLDLDGDGIEIIPIEDGVMFDMGSDGDPDRVAWVGADDGLLALDINQDGQINDQSELFGTLETDGFHILAEHDSNNDGVINAEDAVYDQLLVWQDLNQDGISQAGELRTLSDLGIQSINLAAVMTDYDIGGSWIAYDSTFTYEDGSTGIISDVWFQYIDQDNWNRVVEVMGEEAAIEWLQNAHSTVSQFIPTQSNADWQAGDPLVLGSTHKIFEVGLNDSIITQDGELTVFYGDDEAGEVTGNGSFQVGGSLLNGETLTSKGVDVSVSYDEETGLYVGAAGENVVFTLQINADGSYSFQLLDSLDHGNNVNLSDNILLQFGVTVTDADGDSTDSFIRLQIRDSGSYISDDINDNTDIDVIPEAFIFEAITESAQTLQSFDALGGDTIDISALIQRDNDLSEAISDFVYVTGDSDGNAIISVDSDGANGPAEAAEVVRLNGVSVEEAQAFIENGNIIV